MILENVNTHRISHVVSTSEVKLLFDWFAYNAIAQ